MATLNAVVLEDPNRPGWDALGVHVTARGHFIHQVLATADEPLSPQVLGERAKALAEQASYPHNEQTFSGPTTRNHLVFIEKKGFVKRLPNKLWQLTQTGRARIEAVASGRGLNRDTPTPPRVVTRSGQVSGIWTVDDAGRVHLPASFANATVLIDVVDEGEVRIRKAVVVPEGSLPTIEDTLPPLSDEDRDFFLNLIDNPPQPNAAFLKAAKHYKEWHGRNSD